MIVTIDYVFSKNSKIGSKIIRWSTKHLSNQKNIPSHVAVLVNNRWVFESTLFTGIRIISYKKWLEINTEVNKISGKNMEYSKIKLIFKDLKNKKYDWLGIVYFGYRLFLNKFLNKKIPKNNKLQCDNKYFCSEAAGLIRNNNDYSMSAPVQMMEDFKNG